MFNMIGPYFDGGRVLDLYAGSGGLSIEAVSRGMEQAVLVEKDRRAQAIIASNIQMTKESHKFQLLKMEAHQALSQLQGTFDLVFLDPPYAKEQIGLQVAEGYYNLLFRQELIHVADEQLKLTRETLTKTAAMVQAGKWSRDKLAEVEAQLAKDSVNYLRACSDTELARHQLALIIELPDYTELQITLPDVKSLSAPELALADDALLEQARSMRPEMEQARLQLQVAERQIGLEQTGYIPKVSFGAGYNTGYYYILNKELRQFNQPFGDQMRNNGRYFVGLSLSVPIFDAMRTADNVAQARLRYSDQQIALRKVDKELTQQLYTAQINARAAYSQIAAAERATESAETALHYAQISYEAGRASSYELAEAQNRHFVAQSEELRARYDYLYRVLVLHSYISPAEETK